MAGYFIASMPEFADSQLSSLINTATELGDYEYDQPDHHGSIELRALAIRSGWRLNLSRGGINDNYSTVLCEAR